MEFLGQAIQNMTPLQAFLVVVVWLLLSFAAPILSGFLAYRYRNASKELEARLQQEAQDNKHKHAMAARDYETKLANFRAEQEQRLRESEQTHQERMQELMQFGEYSKKQSEINTALMDLFGRLLAQLNTISDQLRERHDRHMEMTRSNIEGISLISNRTVQATTAMEQGIATLMNNINAALSELPVTTMSALQDTLREVVQAIAEQEVSTVKGQIESGVSKHDQRAEDRQQIILKAIKSIRNDISHLESRLATVENGNGHHEEGDKAA